MNDFHVVDYISSHGKGCEKIIYIYICVYVDIDKPVECNLFSFLSLASQDYSCSNMKHIKHRQFNRNNYIIRL